MYFSATAGSTDAAPIDAAVPPFPQKTRLKFSYNGPQRDAYDKIAGRETELLSALGIRWQDSLGRKIRCPFPDHTDADPSWRWDPKKLPKPGWHCSCGGGDIIDAAIRIGRAHDFISAIKWAEETLRLPTSGGNARYQNGAHGDVAAGKPQQKYAPADVRPKLSQLLHPKLGLRPIDFWDYRSADGKIAEIRARYEGPEIEAHTGGRRKEVLPWTWTGKKWISRQMPGPRPFYRLLDIMQCDGDDILVVEGEGKKLDRAQELFPQCVATTASGGAQAFAGMDYTHFAGRSVIIWPDQDEPGRKYAAGIAARAHAAGAVSIRIVDVPTDWPKHWDLGDDPPPDADLAAMLAAAPRWTPPDVKVKRLNAPDAKLMNAAEPIDVEVEIVDADEVRNIPATAAAFDGLQRAENNKILKNEPNARHVLKSLGITFRYNDFSHFIEIQEAQELSARLDDAEMWAMWLQVWKISDIKFAKDDWPIFILSFARENRFHPVREYLDTLDWDGVDRLDEWLATYLGAENNELNRFIGRTILIAAVCRVRRPGSKFDYMAVFEGRQGIGKSTSIAALCPDPELFTDNFQLSHNTKEAIEQTAGKWIVEIGELAGMRKSDIDHVKSLLSRQTDEARLVYGKLREPRKRQFVFIGTTNETNYLIDPSGNRRFWPVTVGVSRKIDIAAIIRDRDQLWAEAARREADGEPIYPSGEMAVALDGLQKEREVSDEWEGPIQQWLDRNFTAASDAVDKGETTLFEVATSAVGMKTERLDSVVQKRLMRCMARVGWHKARSSNGVNYWRRKKP